MMTRLRQIVDRHGWVPYLVLVVGVLVLSLIPLALYIQDRTTISPDDKKIAMVHCSAWVQQYTHEANPIAICQGALDHDVKAFTFRWSKGVGPT